MIGLAKCNYCGSTQRRLVYSYNFEPRACEVCLNRFFQSRESRVYPVQYNSVEYNQILAALQPRARENLGKKLDNVFSKYMARNMRFYVLGNTLRLVYETEYRRKFGYIVIELDIITGLVKLLRT